MMIDKNKLAESLEKNSLQQTIASIQKFSGKSDVTVIVIKK